MLSGKLALVTGGASGIGLCISKCFAREGAAVCVVDIHKNIDQIAQELIKVNDKQLHMSFKCDVSNSSNVNDLFKKIHETYPSYKCPRVIVNSAGITRDNTLMKLSEEDFDKVIDINLKGTFLVTQAAATALMSNYNPDEHKIPLKTYGSIISIGSIVGKYGNIGQANYAASKAGVEGLTKTVSKELARYNIRCNAVLPGFINTPMTEKIPEKVYSRMKTVIPMGRVGEPDEIAAVCLFLASDMSSYITGASIDCNGGLSM